MNRIYQKLKSYIIKQQKLIIFQVEKGRAKFEDETKRRLKFLGRVAITEDLP